MFDSADYQLLDFGAGRKLERFGAYLIDRPASAATEVCWLQPNLWPPATARFEVVGDQRGPERGRWIPAAALPDHWTIGFGPLRFELKPTDFGHLGVFPEQVANWDWIARQVRAAAADGKRLKVLNLFAHTGGSTLAAAQAGAEIVHVDSARSAIAWARRNAELSSLSAAPIRWIVEDAARFVRRELNRENRYDAVILDPPSYGHGPAGETWKLDDDLSALLAACAELTAGRRRFVLLTCHTPSVTPSVARQFLDSATFGNNDAPGHSSGAIGEELVVRSADGRSLQCGIVAKFSQR